MEDGLCTGIGDWDPGQNRLMSTKEDKQNERHAPDRNGVHDAPMHWFRQLAHDFNNIWAQIFGYVQELKETTDFRDKDGALDRIVAAASRGLLYSRNLMEVAMRSGSHPEVFDACDVIRQWSYRTHQMVQEAIDISCMVPPYPLHIRLERSALQAILLSLVGYALQSGGEKRWVMIGVRTAGASPFHTDDSLHSVDLMFLLGMPDKPPALDRNLLQQRLDAMSTLVSLYGGAVKASVVPAVGINLRIRLPLAAAPEAVHPPPVTNGAGG